MKIPSQRAVMGPDTPIKDESYRRSDIRFIRKMENPNLEFLFDKAWKLAIEANNDWFNFHITKLGPLSVGLTERPRPRSLPANQHRKGLS